MANLTESPRLVLCVDDDADDREMVCFTIKEIDPSFDVVHAENGIEAMQLLSKLKKSSKFPCLIILDINMPKMDGKTTLAEIKKDEDLSKLPVVIFTTYNDPKDAGYYAEHGVEVVTKPSSLHTIKSEVKRLLKHCPDA
ncbi:MAG: response regulator [Chitinophagaceae bacterium]